MRSRVSHILKKYFKTVVSVPMVMVFSSTIAPPIILMIASDKFNMPGRVSKSILRTIYFLVRVKISERSKFALSFQVFCRLLAQMWM